MMSIQTILKEFNIDLDMCIFIIRRHPSSEPTEVREHFRNKTINEFSNALKFQNKTDEVINKVIDNINFLNRILKKISGGFDDFFLFDDYSYFLNYKQKVIDFWTKKCGKDTEKFSILNNVIGYLDNFYKYRSFYLKIADASFTNSFTTSLLQEIKNLFEFFGTNTIVSSKLYARMCLVCNEQMKKLGDLNNPDDFYKIAESLLRKILFFKYPLISKSKETFLSNNDLIFNFIKSKSVFSIDDINSYVEKMHLTRPDNYLLIMLDLSSDYVQISQDTMIKRCVMNLSDYIIDQIKHEICFYINSFGKINTITFKGYNSLPNIGYKWNKYLLAGILRTYLSDTFQISLIGNTYKLVEFEIKLA